MRRLMTFWRERDVRRDRLEELNRLPHYRMSVDEGGYKAIQGSKPLSLLMGQGA